LPSYNEWYKAAYYDPTANGGAGGYWNYSTGSDSIPTAVGSGTTSGTAIYNQPLVQGPADVSLAGGLSPYGVMGLDGNVYEWEESAQDRINNSASEMRGIRGTYFSEVNLNSASVRYSYGPTNDVAYDLGFRVALRPLSSGSSAAVPEPGSMAILGLGGLCLAYYKRRSRRNSAA
jgi:formylglycine-generating enzyme required for sulfatase activity